MALTRGSSRHPPSLSERDGSLEASSRPAPLIRYGIGLSTGISRASLNVGRIENHT